MNQRTDALAAPMQGAKQLTITPDQDGQRVDNFLINHFKIPRSRIYQMIRKGEVRLNGGRIKPKAKLILGAILRIPPFTPSNSIQLSAAQLIKIRALGQSLLEHIIYEDDELIAINKPSGLAVQGGSGIELSLIDAMRTILPAFDLVHRLDRDTSGVILVAKNKATLRSLHRDWDGARKLYVAVIRGHIKDTTIIDLPLSKGKESSGERMVEVDLIAGKASCTKLRTIKRFGSYSLVLAQLLSGRMHQLRVHLSAIGCPIIGDHKYFGDTSDETEKLPNSLKLALQAWKLILPPEFGNMVIKTPINSNISQALELLSN